MDTPDQKSLVLSNGASSWYEILSATTTYEERMATEEVRIERVPGAKCFVLRVRRAIIIAPV
jgi:hypothetical protein